MRSRKDRTHHGRRAEIISAAASAGWIRPDFNPIENAFSKLKAHLRAKAERSVTALWDTVADIIKLFEPDECANYFRAAGYDPD